MSTISRNHLLHKLKHTKCASNYSTESLAMPLLAVSKVITAQNYLLGSPLHIFDVKTLVHHLNQTLARKL